MSFDGSTEGKLKAQNLLCALPLTPFISLEASKTTTELAVALRCVCSCGTERAMALLSKGRQLCHGQTSDVIESMHTEKGKVFFLTKK